MEIKFLLEKYKNLGFSQNKIRDITQSIFQKNNIEIEKENIIVKDSEIHLKITGVKKTEFTLRKIKIQKELLLEFKKEGLFVSKIF